MAQTDLHIHSSLTAGGERCAGMHLARRTARCAYPARHRAGLPPVCTGFSRARARHLTLAREYGLLVTDGSGFLRENLSPHRLGAVTFGGHETDIAAAVLAALTQSEKE